MFHRKLHLVLGTESSASSPNKEDPVKVAKTEAEDGITNEVKEETTS